MKRPYISGPMTNYPHFNFPLFFEVEEYLAHEFWCMPINPARNTGDDWLEAYDYSVNHKETWEHYIRLDLAHVLEAGSIVLLPSWEISRGACLEALVAISLKLPAYFYLEDEDGVVTVTEADENVVYGKALGTLVALGVSGNIHQLRVPRGVQAA